jgi:hypothetical protein
MPSTQNAANNHEYRSVPITALTESASNPRKRFDEKSLEELAAYVPRHIMQSIFSSAARLPAGCVCYGFCKARDISKLRGETGGSDVSELGGQCSPGFCKHEWGKMGGAWLAQRVRKDRT